MKPQKQRLIGSTWTDAKGRTWEVVEMVKPGLYRVRTTDLSRVGESYARDIRRRIEEASPDWQYAKRLLAGAKSEGVK